MKKYPRAKDDWVFTYVRNVEDTEKIKGTAGYDRYALFEVGMTVREFMKIELPGNEPRRVDITYNLVPRPRQTSPNLELSDPESGEARRAREKYLFRCKT